MASLLSNSSLKSGSKLGTTASSSLIRTASTLQNQINTFNDTQAKITYENSSKTDGDLSIYLGYLKGRVDSLQSSGSITDATKAMDMNQTMVTAIHGNLSANIQRENIQIMAGDATPTDKLALIGKQYTTALSIGDQNLAQTLESQGYSLSQTIQTQAQTAMTAQKTLISAAGGSQEHVATTLTNNLKQLNADVSAGGMSNLNANLKIWVATNKDSLLKLASGPNIDPTVKASIEKAVNTSQPNYQDILTGVGNAIISAHYLAYQTELPADPTTANSYLDAASSIANGSTKLPTLAGNLSLQDVQTWQQNPSMFIPQENANTGVLKFDYGGNAKATGESAITGYKFDAQGNVIANFSGAATGTKLNQQQVSQVNTALQKLGVSYKQVTTSDSMDNGIAVQFNGKVPKWLQPVTSGQQNLQTRVFVTPQGLQLATIDQSGKGHVYLVAQDSNNNHALYEGSPDQNGNVTYAKQNATGDYGFNQSANSLIQAAKVTNGNYKVVNNVQSKTNAPSYMSGDSSRFMNLVTNSQIQVNNMQQSKNMANNPLGNPAKPIAMSLPTLPSISMPAPLPNPVAQPMPTANPQPATANPQQQNTLQLQSSNSVNLLQGGGGGTGIRLQ